MQSKYSLTGKKLKQSFVHHNTRPGTAFFPAEKLDVWSHQNLYLLKAVRLRQVT